MTATGVGESDFRRVGVIAGATELCGRLGDEIDQAAWCAGILMTSMPFWNLTPWTTFGN